MPYFHRKCNRLARRAYQGQQWYFITICTHERRNLFCEAGLVNLLLQVLREKCSSRSFGVYAYCFMPDHLHLQLAGLSKESDLIALIRDFKGGSSARARRLGLSNVWQKSFYDHVMRPGEQENTVAWYIFNNPVRKAFVNDPREWPHSGSWMFDWKKAVAPLEEFVPPWKITPS